MIRRAELSDIEALLELDIHIERGEYEYKIQTGRVLIFEQDNQIIGWLRYNMFWDQIPFMTLLYILEPYRGQGIGQALMNYWETEMMAMGNYLAMTSSQSDEDAQHFYRKFGYQDSGNLLIPGENLELIFIKNLIR